MAMNRSTREQPRRQITRRGVPVHRTVSVVAMNRAKAPLDLTGGTLPTTPSDADDHLPATHALDDEKDDDSDRSEPTLPLYIPEEDPLKNADPTSGHVQKAEDEDVYHLGDDSRQGDERVPGMEPPDAAPIPDDLESIPPDRQPPDAASVPDDKK